MNDLATSLSGMKILEEKDSPINGKLTVIRDLAWGTYIQAGNITQSGGIAERIWKNSLKKTKAFKKEVRSCLILGLGGGGLAKWVRKYWPESQIIGVEIDPIMVDLGKKYLGLEKTKTEIVIQDGLEFCQEQKKKGKQYDLICVDAYLQDQVPPEFETDDFLELIKDLLKENGIAIFNRLYYTEKRKSAEEFHRRLINQFNQVRPVYPEANVMYLCFNRSVLS